MSVVQITGPRNSDDRSDLSEIGSLACLASSFLSIGEVVLSSLDVKAGHNTGSPDEVMLEPVSL